MNPNLIIAGVGMVPFRRPGHSDPYDVMAEAAIRAALADARIDYEFVDEAFAGFVLADSCSGQRALYRVGISGIPITNVSNNCASGSTALYLARQAVLAGEAECALAVGFEEMRPGALDRAFPLLADPLERHRDCVDEAMHFGDKERAMPPALQLFSAQLEWMRSELGIGDDAFAQGADKAGRTRGAILCDLPRSAHRRRILAQPPLFGHLSSTPARRAAVPPRSSSARRASPPVTDCARTLRSRRR
jgi:acetyl-CoA C-acetyltransferase